jgi:hypothetical protein
MKLRSRSNAVGLSVRPRSEARREPESQDCRNGENLGALRFRDTTVVAALAARLYNEPVRRPWGVCGGATCLTKGFLRLE